MFSDSNVFSRSPESDIPPIVTPLLFNSKYKKKDNTITLDKQLGKGGFGTVYLCHNENNEQLAVKCIKTKDYGVPSLFEASIMATIQHPNLSFGIKIHASPQKLYIVQELAISDLKAYRSFNDINNTTMISWIHDIVQGLKCLHNHDIIHGDLKASNVLVYPDNKIRISDFTLSTHNKWTNNFRPCTQTHRPLEVWMGEKWDETVDIWALGCTIYEMVYGSSLFVNQNKDASINAIIDWHTYLPMQYKSPDILLIKRETFHYTFSLPPSFNTSDPINVLILSLLIVSPRGRPNINEVSNNTLFEGLYTGPSNFITNPITTLTPKTESKIRKSISNIISNHITVDLAYDLYTRTVGMINANDKIKLVTCTWIANKITERENISFDRLTFELHEILQMERMICNYLSYRLYCKSSKVVFNESKKEK